jgi:hydroxymethylbilane synthase
MVLRIATRGSDLARWQADHVADALGSTASVASDAEVELVIIETTGDRRSEIPIWEMGGKGVFVKEVQAAVLDHRADVAVHSAKDLPSETPSGLTIGAVLERADPRDVLVGSTLAELPTAAVVATGSARRRAQLAWLRSDLTFAELRGNIPTRLEKAVAFDAIVMAAAALDRLGMSDRISERLDTETMLPQVGQGAVAIECRVDDERTRALLAAIEHEPTRLAVDAERAFLAELGGDCDLPAGAHAIVDVDGEMTVDGLLASMDGHVVLRHQTSGRDPRQLGSAVARHLLDDAGGAALLEV